VTFFILCKKGGDYGVESCAFGLPNSMSCGSSVFVPTAKRPIVSKFNALGEGGNEPPNVSREGGRVVGAVVWPLRLRGLEGNGGLK